MPISHAGYVPLSNSFFDVSDLRTLLHRKWSLDSVRSEEKRSVFRMLRLLEISDSF